MAAARLAHRPAGKQAAVREGVADQVDTMAKAHPLLVMTVVALRVVRS